MAQRAGYYYSLNTGALFYFIKIDQDKATGWKLILGSESEDPVGEFCTEWRGLDKMRRCTPSEQKAAELAYFTLRVKGELWLTPSTD